MCKMHTHTHACTHACTHILSLAICAFDVVNKVIMSGTIVCYSMTQHFSDPHSVINGKQAWLCTEHLKFQAFMDIYLHFFCVFQANFALGFGSFFKEAEGATLLFTHLIHFVDSILCCVLWQQASDLM